jgi:hypothetical protein
LWHLGIGIYAENSSFIVEKDDDATTIQDMGNPLLCEPDGDETTFTNLEYGILTDYCNSVKVRGCVFNEVNNSICFNSDINSVIYDNNFYYHYPPTKECYDPHSNVPLFINLNSSEKFDITNNSMLEEYADSSCFSGQQTSPLVLITNPISDQNTISKIHYNEIYLIDPDCSQDKSCGLFIDITNPYSPAYITITCNKFSEFWHEGGGGIIISGDGPTIDLGDINASANNVFMQCEPDISYEPLVQSMPNILCYYSSLDYNWPFYPPESVNKIDLTAVSNTRDCLNFNKCQYYDRLYYNIIDGTIADVVSTRKIVIVERENDGEIVWVYNPEYFIPLNPIK